MRKLLFIGLTGLLLLALLVASLVFTGPGLKLLLRVAAAAGVTIEYSQVSGSLANFEISGLNLNAAGTAVSADRLNLAWQPMALLGRNVIVQQVGATGLVIDLPEAQPDAPASAPLDLEQGIALPVSVRLDLLTLDGLTLRQAGKPMAEVTSAKLANLELTSDRWQVAQLEVAAAAGSARLDGWLEPDRLLSHQLHLAASAGTDNINLDVAGNASQTRIEMNLNQTQVTASAELSSWTRDPAWELLLEANAYQGIREARIQGSGNLRAGQGEAQVELDDGRTVALRQWRFAQTPQGHWSVHLDGGTTPVEVLADLELDGSQLYASTIRMTSTDDSVPKIAIEASGAFTQLGFRADVELNQATPAGPGQVTLAGRLQDFNSVVIDLLDGRLLGGSVTGDGTVDFSDGLAANLELETDQLNLASIDERLPSGVSGQIKVQSTRPQGQLKTRLELTLSALQGQTPVTIDGHADLLEARPVGARLTLLATQANRLEVRLNNTDSVQVDASIADLAVLLPGLSGQIEADVSASQIGAWPALDGSVSINNLALAQGTGVTDARLLLAADSLDLTATGVTASGQQIDNLHLTVAGRPESHQFTLEVAAPSGGLKLAGAAAWTNEQYRYTLDSLTAQLPQDLTISNEKAISGTVGASMIQLDPACLTGSELRLCLAGETRGAEASGSLAVQSAAIEKLPWRELQPGPETFVLPQGALDVALSLSSLDGSVQVEGRIDLATLRIEEAGGDGLSLEQIALEVSGSPRRADLTLAAQLPGGELKGNGQILDLNGDATVDGRLFAALANVSVLSVLIPDAQLERGSAQIDIAVSGPLATPQLVGTIALTGVGADLPQLGIKPDVDLTITLPQTGAGKFDGTVVSGVGRATLSGEATWDGALNLRGELNGSELLVANSETISLAASPALRIDIKGNETRIGGSINVDRGHVALTTGTSGGPNASQDVIIVDAAENEEAVPASRLALDVRVDLDQPIEINGFGLTGALEGGVTVRQNPGEPLLANGELNLTGQYAAFGQKLSITEGRLIYVNTPLDNPAIELYAGREVDDVKVGVRVTGRASALSATLESDPVLNESEQLSLLVLGRRLGALDEAQSDQLGGAALSLALSQGNKALGGLGGGMPNLSLTQELGGLAVAVGKQLSPRLYVGYTVDLLKPVQVVQVRYRLGESWTAETELGLESSGAIRYRQER